MGADSVKVDPADAGVPPDVEVAALWVAAGEIPEVGRIRKVNDRS